MGEILLGLVAVIVGFAWLCAKCPVFLYVVLAIVVCITFPPIMLLIPLVAFAWLVGVFKGE